MSVAQTDAPNRLGALRRGMRAADVDGAVIGVDASFVALLGWAPVTFERFCALFVSEQAATLVAPLLNVEEAKAHLDVAMLPWADTEGPAGAIAAALGQIGRPRRVAVDPDLNAGALLALQRACTAEFVDAASLLAELIAVKTPQELERLGAAAAVADSALRAAIDTCRPGNTEIDVADAVFDAFREHGSEPLFAEIGSGPNGALPLHMHGERVLQAGDVVRLDLGGSTDGFASDICRTIAIGHAGDRFLDVYDVIERAGVAAMAVVAPGVPAGEVDRAARAVIDEAGYGAAVLHRTGHGLGRSLHEPPWIVATNDMPLREGMVFSVEPGIYLPGEFGVRTEDIVAVTADGCRPFSALSRELEIVPA